MASSISELLADVTQPCDGTVGAAACRLRAARTALLVAFMAGTMALPPIALVASSAGRLPDLMAYGIAYVLVIVLLAVRSIDGRLVRGLTAALPMAIGVVLFAASGPSGVGSAWLAAAPLFAGLLLGTKPGFASLLVSAAALAGFQAMAVAGVLPWMPPHGYRLSWAISACAVDCALLLGMRAIDDAACDAVARARSALAGHEAAAADLRAAEEALRAESAARAEAERSARRQDSLFKGLLGHSADLILLLDADGRVRLCGPASVAVLGYRPEDMTGRDFFSFVGEEYADDRRAMFTSNLVSSSPAFSSRFAMVRQDGSTLPVEASASNFLNNPDIIGVVLTLKDVTRETKAEERAEFYEHYDPLTRLINRDTFIHEVERAVTIARNRQRVFGVMALGLDRFKRVNDMYGTEAGDKVLRYVAQALRSTFRNDDIVSRYRGDKFFALFPEISSQEHIKEIIAKARAAFVQPVRMDLGDDLSLSASMGVALFPNDGKDAEDLVRNAETALYMAKESGRDRYRLFDARLNGEILERQRIESDLTVAIGERRFEPYFQAKVDREGRIIGAEALVRWRLPSGDVRQPGYFIDVAEKSGNIDRIGDLILRMTCEMAASWKADGLPGVPVSVNLSPRQFAREDLVDSIRATVGSTGLDPTMLELEITESGIMENEREGIRKLMMLKDFGAAVSIDDFGTGYSSFSKLKDYPVDTVKMDKSFIDPLPSDRKATIIASAIVDLAHTLSFKVVAEGVENADQLRFLDTIFCDSFQGYLFSKPVPEREFRKLLAGGRLHVPG